MKLHSKAGFSLLEVIISIGILSISLLAIFNLQSTSILGASRARRISTCTQLARQKMAQVLLDIEKGIPKGEFPEAKEEEGTFEEEKFPDYSWKLVIKKTEIPPPPAPEGGAEIMIQAFTMVAERLSETTREVKLTISWKEFDEDQVGIVLTTHVVKVQ